jgi:hypothetical protein
MGYIKKIEMAGFTVIPRKTKKDLPVEILKRYKNIPPEYLTFLQQFEQITNREDTAWFNSIEDFCEESDSDFAWNEFERMSLEALEDDETELRNIRTFWNNHIPIMLSVTEYQYIAICLDSERYGEIVYGVEPEFEETLKVCDNFNELMDLFENTTDNQYIRRFV